MLKNKISKIPEDAIDLGLPSGILWCSHNVGAESETDYGLYFSWGSVEGHEQGSGYNFSENSSHDESLMHDIDFNNVTYDAATANMGGKWRMPTKAEFKELHDNTVTEWTTINGIKGRKFMKKGDRSVYIFFPAAGGYEGTSLNFLGSDGYYWSSSFYDISNAYNMGFYSSYVYTQNINRRRFGFSVRGVYIH